MPSPGSVGGACAQGLTSCANGSYVTGGLSPTAYDLVRIGGWALLIFGAVIVVFALVREIRR